MQAQALWQLRFVRPQSGQGVAFYDKNLTLERENLENESKSRTHKQNI